MSNQQGMAQFSNPPPASVQDDYDDFEEEEKKKKKGVCKTILKFAFSHIGLCGMVVAYAVAGGFIFENLESKNEKELCTKRMNKYYPFENQTVDNLWSIAENFRDAEFKDVALEEYEKILSEYTDTILDLGYDLTNCTAMGETGGPAYKWSFAGSLLFSVTVITTIGYGNIAPMTDWGRIVCIAYAILGIPLMLLCLANIGDVMADIFRFVYSMICCCGCCRKKKRRREENSPDGSDPSLGRDTPTTRWQARYNNQDKVGGAVPPTVVDDYDDYDSDDDDDDEEEHISVPLTITMGVIAGFIVMGALLFGQWEGWSPLEAAYFCFVTISTIGFGDYVPGSSTFESADDNWKMILSSIYMMFGMAILSMCFALIQEEIVAKFQWLGEKLGIVDQEKDEEEEEEEEDEGDDENPNGTKQPETDMEKEQRPGVHHGSPLDPSNKKHMH